MNFTAQYSIQSTFASLRDDGSRVGRGGSKSMSSSVVIIHAPSLFIVYHYIKEIVVCLSIRLSVCPLQKVSGSHSTQAKNFALAEEL